MNISKTIKYLLSAALAIVLLWLSFRDVDWNEFVKGFAECSWGFVLLSMAAGAASFWIRGLRWRRLLLPLDDSVSRTSTFNGINIANLANFAFPRLGEFVRCGLIVRRSHGGKLSFKNVLGTVILERVWELLVMILLLGLVILLRIDRFGDFFYREIWLVGLARFDSNVWVLLVAGIAACCLGVWAIWALRSKSKFCGRIVSFLKGLVQGFASCLKMPQKWIFFAQTVLIWLIYWFMLATIMWSLPDTAHLGLIDALFLSLIGGLGFVIPVPGGIGAYHFIVTMSLSAIYGIPEQTGLVFATLSHSSQAITQILFGAGSYIYETVKK
jgi:uncharacterized protein (TIRG00374 family)